MKTNEVSEKGPLRVMLLYKRHAAPDEELMRFLESRLEEEGFQVFIDRHLELGVEWAKEIELQIRQSDAIVPLISSESARSEMMGFEIENAHETAQFNHGLPRILPIRIQYTGPVPEPMGGILSPIQYFLWEGPQDNEGVITELVYALRHIEASESEPVVEAAPTEGRITPSLPVQPSPKSPIAQKTLAGIPFALESIGGAVPLNSEFYLQRPADTELRSALDRADSIILIKGARQMGKTSLLARGLQYAREQGTHTAVTDLQKFNAINLLNANNFYLTLAESLVDQLDLPIVPSTLWDPRRSPNMNFERFIRREILGKISGRLVWGLDEVDRLFGCAFGSEVFGLFRSWHNERALDPMGPWSKFTFVITYATEAHLFITDLNQSPFNVGTRIELEDFTPAQVSDLNHRYHSPIKDEDKVARFTRLLSGHPYLVRRGLHELSGFESSYDDFELHAARDEGIYGDHLRRILVLLAKDKSLENVVRAVLVGEGCPTKEFFYRLRSAGIISGTAPTDARLRCRLYAMFLKRHLLNSGTD